jgi:trk system potassium uptake protein
MKIIIIGAGQTGSAIATHLASEDNDITVIERNKKLLSNISGQLDIRTIQGNGSHPYILEQADAKEADMIIAVTDIDEVNMAACQVAYTMFGVQTKIARIRSHQYTTHKKLFKNEDVPIDRIISPELMMTNHIKNLIKYPGASQIISFSGDLVTILSIKITSDSHLLKANIIEIQKKHSQLNIVALLRKDKYINIEQDTLLKQGDEVFLVTEHINISKVLYMLTKIKHAYKKIIIAGGGNIGQSLAAKLENDYKVKLIDHNSAHCQQAAATLENTIVLEGEATNLSLLLEENIDLADIFCAVTNNDESNILSSALAKHKGVKRAIAIVNNPGYLSLIEDTNIDLDVSISPQKVTVNSLLSLVRQQYAHIVKVHSLQAGYAEVFELKVTNPPGQISPLIDLTIENINLPKEFIICAIIRDNKVITDKTNTGVQEHDHLIIFLTDKHKLKKLKAFLTPID